MAAMDNQLMRFIIFFAMDTLQPVSISAGVVGASALLNQLVVGGVLAYHQALVRLRTVMMYLRFWWKWFAQGFFSHNDVLMHKTVDIGLGVIWLFDEDITIADGPPVIPGRVVFSKTMMVMDELSGDAANYCGFLSTPTLTKAFRNLDVRGIFGKVHEVCSLLANDWIRAAETPLTSCGSFFYSTDNMGLQT
jgi:hypothetical protein